MVLRGKMLLSKSGILWFYGAFTTTGNSEKKTRLNHDVCDLQVVTLERGPISGLGMPSRMTVQNVFSQSELDFSQVPSCLEINEV